ncbi:uncharacterized protein BKA78DRAFT_295255 [Phyllosticta capitalensis]|uniref:uncharacterized protein n=1 Tax=Phyllosticta capitalensis TaxID=121624 RepID=UPI00312DA289
MSSSPISEEDQGVFANFSGVVGSVLSPEALAAEMHTLIPGQERGANWLNLARRDRRLVLRSDAGAMALGLMEALPDLSHEAIVELVRREIGLTEGEASSLLHLVSSVSGDEESAVADYNPDSEVEGEEVEEGSEPPSDGDGDNDEDDDDDDDDDEGPLREMSSSELNRRRR